MLYTNFILLLEQGSRNQQQNEPNDEYNGNMANLSSAPLNDTLKTLKYKYIELQESHKKDVKVKFLKRHFFDMILCPYRHYKMK